MPQLQYVYDKGRAVGAKFPQGTGFSCLEGSSFTSDEGLSALEKYQNEVLIFGHENWSVPNFPLSKEAVRAAASQQMSNRSRVVPSVHYQDVKRTRFHNPMPTLANYDLTKELIEACGGNVATAQMISNSNSIGCAPPRGERGISGKDRYYSSACTAVFQLGPFCTTNYLDLRNFGEEINAYMKAAIQAGGMALEYERVRRFVEMSRKNAVAQVGTISPRFVSGAYGDMPTSPGSLEWILRSIDEGLGADVMADVPIVVKTSPQLRKYWINKYNRDHGATIQESLGSVFNNVKDYVASFEMDGDFVMRSLRTGRKVIFRVDSTPLYVETYATGTDLAEWDFQDYFLTRPGEDPESGAANGFVQTGNPHYGDPTKYCEGVPARLCEQILIYTQEAFHYEAFPTNPLGWAMQGVETNLQNLWNATQISWRTGAEVQIYDLGPINRGLAGTGYPELSNSRNTWFAGELTVGHQFIEDRPRKMMSLLVRVPMDESPLEGVTELEPAERPAPIVLDSRPTKEAPQFCTPIPAGVAEDTPGAGLAWTPVELQYDLGATDRVAYFTLYRTGGTNGTLTLPLTVTEGTALEGTAGTDHFKIGSATYNPATGVYTPTYFSGGTGNIVFADGSETQYLAIFLNSVEREAGDPATVSATINVDNSPVVLNTGAVEAITLTLRLYDPA